MFEYGYQSDPNIEVLRGDDQRNVQFPSMPHQQKEYVEEETTCDLAMVTIHNGSILYFLHEDDKNGTMTKPSKCYKLEQGNWKIHSILNEDRGGCSIVGTKNATYIFGGAISRNTFEYLPRGATKWIVGENEIPGKGFTEGCAIATKSGEDILLIAGEKYHSKRILSFNTKTHVFKELSTKLILEVCTWNQCMYIPGTNKIMMIGIEQCRKCRPTLGVDYSNTLILDLNDWSMTIASPMKFKRDVPGIGIITIDDQDRLAAIGGITRRDNQTYCFMNIELFNASTGKWEMTNIVPKKPLDLSNSQFFSVRQSDLSGLGLWLKIPSKFKSVEINRRF